jgi:hypothetical protein
MKTIQEVVVMTNEILIAWKLRIRANENDFKEYFKYSTKMPFDKKMAIDAACMVQEFFECGDRQSHELKDMGYEKF